MSTRQRIVRSLFVVTVVPLCVYLVASLFVPLAAQVGQAPQMAPPEAQFFGGAGDQVGQAIAFDNATRRITIGSDNGDLIQYQAPLGPPIWRTHMSGTTVRGLAISGRELAAAGHAIPPACGARDWAGSVENKSMVERVDSVSGGVPLCESRTLTSYSGHESYSAAAWNDGVLYVTGGAETCGFGHYTFVLSRIVAGAAPASVAEPGVDFKGYSCLGASSSTGLVALNGSLYIAGYSRLSSEDGVFRPVLMKYRPDLVRVWKQRPADVAGAFNAVTMTADGIVAVGYAVDAAGRTVFLQAKFDESGTRVWSRTSTGVAEGQLNGVVAVGARLFAVGSITSAGSGGSDAVVLEIDPASGETKSLTLWGGNLDDTAFAAATDGVDLFVAAASRSYASPEGNLVGQNDGVLLRFPLSAPTTAVTLTTSPAGLSMIVDGEAVSSPTVVHWQPGSTHTIEVPTPQPSGDDSRFVFKSWSDGGARAHTITAPSAPTTLVATLSEQHRLALAVSPAGGGAATATPPSSDNFYDSGSVVSIAAVPAPGYQFASFSGDLAGATSSQVLDMNGSRSVTANFSACAFKLSPASLSVPPGASTATLGVSTGARCYWTVASKESWVAVTSGAAGTGPGSVGLSIASNAGAARSTTITVAGLTFTIEQAAGCAVLVNPTRATSDSAGDRHRITVSATAGCGWTASSSVPWLSIASGSPGSGDGSVVVTALPNTGTMRTGAVTVAGTAVTVTQRAGACGAVDVSSQVSATRGPLSLLYPSSYLYSSYIRVTNNTSQAIAGPVYVATLGLPTHRGYPRDVGLLGTFPLTTCFSSPGDYLVLVGGGLAPRQRIDIPVTFWSQSLTGFIPLSTKVVSGRPSR